MNGVNEKLVWVGHNIVITSSYHMINSITHVYNTREINISTCKADNFSKTIKIWLPQNSKPY